MARLTRNVWVRGRWYGPSYPDAGDPPAGAITNRGVYADGDGARPAAPAQGEAGRKTGAAGSSPEPTPPPGPAPAEPTPPPAHAGVVVTDPPAETTPPGTPASTVGTPPPPPRHGKGSGNGPWRDWANRVGLDGVSADDGRADIIAVAVRAGLIADDE